MTCTIFFAVTYFFSQPTSCCKTGWYHRVGHTTSYSRHSLLQHAPFSSASHWYQRVGRTPYSRHTCYYTTHLFLQPVDGPLPLGGGDQQIVLGQTAAVAETHQELDALVRPPTVRHVVQPYHRCKHGKNKATSRKLWRQGVHSRWTCCGQWLDLLQSKKNTQ